MATMQMVGVGHVLPPHARVREQDGEYLIELDVSDFTETELTVELLGRAMTVCGDQTETVEEEGRAFRLRERLTETFRLPDDADVDAIEVFFKHGTLQIRAKRTPLTPRQLPIGHPSPYTINPNAEAC